MEKALYGFNSSQDVIHLQTKYSLFGRVANIVFSTVVEDGFDKDLMKKAINELIARNDCLRITFVKKDKKILQYFADNREIKNIPYLKLDSVSKQDAFINKFRLHKLNCFKGETLKVAFATNPDGKDVIFFKISHYVADTYGIGILISDLFAVYSALKEGRELPEAPGSFEEVLKKDLDYKDNTESVERDREFFNAYYGGKKAPMYCGIHGNNSDIWMKHKRKGEFSIPYLFVKCDTEGYKLAIPAAVTNKAVEWCKANNITLSAFFYYTFSIAASVINDKEKYLAPLMLLDCRGTMAERKAAGTKVQSISIYTTVDYDKSFTENISSEYADQNQLFRHTKLSYLNVEAMQHKLWNYSMLGQVIAFCYSFIPFSAPQGVTMQIHSNGKGALTTYVALMLNSGTNEIEVAYDIQTKMTSARQLMDFHNLYLHVIETVLDKPEEKLATIL